MIDSVLSRFSGASLQNTSTLTGTQAALDGLVSHFVEESSDWKSLALVSTGSVFYRLGRIGALSLAPQAGRAAVLMNAVSYGAGLSAEASAFQGGSRLMAFFSGDRSNPNLWRWEGRGGWREGLVSSGVNFGMLRFAGFAARGENLFVQHLFQDGAMVAGNQILAFGRLIPRPEGSLAEQFLQAEALNLQMSAGAAFVHGLLPGLHAWESGLDFSLRARKEIPGAGVRDRFASFVRVPAAEIVSAGFAEIGLREAGRVPSDSYMAAVSSREAALGLNPQSGHGNGSSNTDHGLRESPGRRTSSGLPSEAAIDYLRRMDPQRDFPKFLEALRRLQRRQIRFLGEIENVISYLEAVLRTGESPGKEGGSQLERMEGADSMQLELQQFIAQVKNLPDVVSEADRRSQTPSEDGSMIFQNQVLDRMSRLIDRVNLTAREREVFGYFLQGVGKEYAGGQMGISLRTVKFHVGHMLEKMGARNHRDFIRIVHSELTREEPLRSWVNGQFQELAVRSKLTSREREVFDCILTGASYEEIADRLGITERTVKFHALNIFAKTGADDYYDFLRVMNRTLMEP
ncbi:MAG: LuxR C-terminal-related transcriptional regulator [bacterium]